MDPASIMNEQSKRTETRGETRGDGVSWGGGQLWRPHCAALMNGGIQMVVGGVRAQ